MRVTVYVNGKPATKKEISKMEITNENVKRIFAEKLKKKDCA